MTLISLDITSLTLKKAWRVMKEQQQMHTFKSCQLQRLERFSTMSR